MAVGGPASLLIAFILIGAVLFCTVQALGEMAVTFPVAGSFSTFATRFIDPAWGFACGWNYAMQWLFTFPLEIMAASITLEYVSTWTLIHPTSHHLEDIVLLSFSFSPSTLILASTN